MSKNKTQLCFKYFSSQDRSEHIYIYLIPHKWDLTFQKWTQTTNDGGSIEYLEFIHNNLAVNEPILWKLQWLSAKNMLEVGKSLHIHELTQTVHEQIAELRYFLSNTELTLNNKNRTNQLTHTQVYIYIYIYMLVALDKSIC